MAKKTLTESFSESSWQDSSLPSTPSSLSLNRKASPLQNPLHPVDETPDFHDPYSNLSLFLSGKIKEEMKAAGPMQKWTVKLQEELIQRITPEFQKKFPEYRLGVSALKKIWEKILFYTQQIQEKKEAIGQDGKLNISFFIRENLKHYLHHKGITFPHPYQIAHQIATKMSECIATLEGSKPKVDLLTQIIWSLQKHLLKTRPLQTFKAPYESFDKIDKLIVRTLLNITARYPYIGMEELEHRTRESLTSLRDLPDFASFDKVTCNVSALLAEKLYATSSFHTRFFSKQKEAVTLFITKHSCLYKNTLAPPQIPDLVRRILALYTLASQLPKNIEREDFRRAALFAMGSATTRPALPQSIYAFIGAELLLLRAPTSCEKTQEEMEMSLFTAYQDASLLPLFPQEEKELLEIVIWKTLSETEGFLERLPYKVGQRIEEEIASLLIEDPLRSFSSLVHETCQFFKKVKELTEQKKWEEADQKMHLWCLQNDMLCRFIHLTTDTPLGRLIKEKWQGSSHLHSHSTFVNEICQAFNQKFPSTSLYLSQLSTRTWTLYKYLWFTLFADEEETSFDRFLKWHILLLQEKERNPTLLIEQLGEICKKSLPLIPFDPQYALALLTSLQKQEYA